MATVNDFQVGQPGPERGALRPGRPRASVRHAPDGDTRCRLPLTSLMGPPLPATIQNISAGGIGLCMGRWFGPGTLLVVELANPSRGYRASFPALVVHAVFQSAEKNWFLGCSWAKSLTEAELAELV